MTISARTTARTTCARRALAAFAALAVAAFAPVLASAQQADPYAFEKKAFKPDGTPWSGPVNVGDTVKYVLSYKPGAVPSGPVTIDDQLSPNQTYAAPTNGPGWTWGSSPYTSGNHETYTSSGFGPGNSVKVTVTGNPVPTPGAGDGTIPVPILSLNKVFGVFHHSGNAADSRVDCWNINTLAKCGTAQPNAVSGILHTPLTPQSVVRGSRIFFPAYRPDKTATFGCFDGASGASGAACPDTPVPATVSNTGDVGGVVEDGSGRMFMAVKNKLFCMTESGGALSPCGGAWPATGLVSVTIPATPAYASSDVYLLAGFAPSTGRIYIHHGSAVLQCIETATATPCGGWTGAGVKIPAKSTGIMLSSLPASGATGDGGVCLWQITTGLQTGCVSSSGTIVSATPASLGVNAISSLRIASTGKILIPAHFSTGPKCLEFSGSSGSPCGAPFPITMPASGTQYGFAMDPSRPSNCVLALGHLNLLWRFDYMTGEVGCGSQTVSTPPVEQLFCNGAPSQFQWSSVAVATAGAAGTLTIKQGSTTATLTLISGTSSYPMPAQIAPGSGPLTLSYSPASGTPVSVDLAIGYTADKNPEICYQAKVAKCGPVFNDAVMKASLNGAAVSVSRRVDLGIAKGPECDVKPPVDVSCLSGKAEVACGKVPGTYVITLKTQGNGGVTPDVVSIAPQTAGVTILNPQASYPVINGTVKFTVAGAQPGDTLAFDMEGTVIGGGAVEGSDLCCNGTIKVEIPKDLPCEKSTVDVTKLCDAAVYRKYALGPAIDAIGWVSSCKITVKTTGPQTGTLSVADQLSGGGTLLGVSSASTPAWNCGPTGCSINGGQLNQTASTSVFTAQVAFASKGHALEARNCATVYGRQKPLDRDCTKITVVDDPQEPEVKITKLCGPAKQLDSPVLQYGAKCKITVTTTGAIQTHLVVSDALTGNGQVTSFTNTSTPAWTCIPGQCDMDGANLNQTSSVSTFEALVTFPAGQGPEQATARNCAKLGMDAHPVMQSCADIAAEKDNFKLDVKKDCSGVIALTANGPWAGSCAITVTATGGPRPPVIAFTDTIIDTNPSRTPPVMMTGSQSADPWACAGSAPSSPVRCSIAGNAFPASGTSTINFNVQVPLGVKSGEAKNCVKAFGAADAQTLSPSNPAVSTGEVCAPLPGGKGEQLIAIACDPATATHAGDLCRCRFDNMNPVSKTACECKQGFTLKAGQGCVRKVAEPKCDPATTVAKGGKCVCEYKNMVQTSPTACACAKGFKFAAGKGCVKPDPVCKKGFEYNAKRKACVQIVPECRKGTVFNPKNGKCVPVQPVCKKPFVYDAKRNACVEVIKRCEPGTVPFKGKCIKMRKCGPGQIAIPGTGICVGVGGGGRPKGGGECIPSATRTCD